MKAYFGILFFFIFPGQSIVSAAGTNVQGLVETLREDDEKTAKAAQEMLLSSGDEAIRPLQRALGDSNFILRRRAAEVLARFGVRAKRAAPDFVQLLVDPQPEVQAVADQALAHLGDDAVPALVSALKSKQMGLRKVAVSTLGRCGPKGIPVLLEVLKKDESAYIRASAATALGEEKAFAETIVPALVPSLSDLEEGTRGAVVDALGGMGNASKAAIGPLISISLDDKDSLVRKKALDALHQIGPATKDSLSGLIAGLRDPSVDVRRQMVATLRLSSIPWPDASPVLASALKDSDPAVRLEAVQASSALGAQGSERLALLRQAAVDSIVEVRAAAITGLGLMKDSAAPAAEELQRLLADANPVIRQDTIRALGNLGVAGLPGLVLALRDNYSVLSDLAAKEIIQLGPEAIPTLQTLKTGLDPLLRKRATQLLKRIEKSKPPHKTKR